MATRNDIEEVLQALRPGQPARRTGELFSRELFWRERQTWLEEHGYLLRPRYKPDWVPSWKDTKKRQDRCEDGIRLKTSVLIDATRIADGEKVVIKSIQKSTHPYEAEIGLYFSSEPLASDPRNHCVRVYEVLQDPIEEDISLIVMSFLRVFQDPPFETVGEVVDFVHQIFEGLCFMHEHHVAHRDCNANNTMMDPKPLFPNFYHPAQIDRSPDLKSRAKCFSRTEHPTKYYFVDFGISQRYRAEDLPPSERVVLGGDKSPPEHKDVNSSCDPFPTDVYYIGNAVQTDFLKKKKRLDFLTPLVQDMIQEDPSKRPTMPDVVARFEQIRSSLKKSTLAQRLPSRKEFILLTIVLDLLYRGRRVNIPFFN